MKTSSVVAVIAAFGVIGLAPATAQPLEVGPPVVVDSLQPQEVLGIARANGFRPLGPPLQQGRAYVLRAIEPGGDPVHVVVDARSGRILSVTPMDGVMMRYGYGASPYRQGPMDEPPPYGRPGPYGPMPRMTGPYPEMRPPGSVPTVTSDGSSVHTAAVTPPRTPLPRPRPTQAAVATPADVKAPEAAAEPSPRQSAPASKDGQEGPAAAPAATTTPPSAGAMPPVTPLE